MMIVIVIGTPITYMVVDSFWGTALILSYSFTALPILTSFPILIIISMVIPSVCFKKISKISLVKSLRDIDYIIYI